MAPRAAVQMPQGLLTTKQAASWMGISERKFVTLGIRRVKIGASVRYDLRDLQLYADLNGDRPRLERAG